MRVLSVDEFVKKVRRACERDSDSIPLLEVRSNWQLHLIIPADVNAGQREWLGPRIDDMSKDDYILFLSKVDEHVGSSLAQSYIQDLTRR